MLQSSLLALFFTQPNINKLSTRLNINKLSTIHAIHVHTHTWLRGRKRTRKQLVLVRKHVMVLLQNMSVGQATDKLVHYFKSASELG